MAIKPEHIEQHGDRKGMFSAMEEVNGIMIDVSWDSGYRNYTLYLPGLKTNEETYEIGINDNNVRFAGDKEEAAEVFEQVKSLAANMEDPTPLKLMAAFQNSELQKRLKNSKDLSEQDYLRDSIKQLEDSGLLAPKEPPPPPVKRQFRGSTTKF